MSDETVYQGIGNTLRSTRERAGLDLRTVSAQLRIRHPHLEAMEAGRFEELPGRIYAIGFLRTYAEFLRLDPDAVVEAYKEESSAVQGQGRLVFPIPAPETRTPSGWLIILCLIVVGGLYAAWYYSHTKSRVATDLAPPTADTSPTAQSAASGNAQKPAEPGAATTPVRPPPGPSASGAAPGPATLPAGQAPATVPPSAPAAAAIETPASSQPASPAPQPPTGIAAAAPPAAISPPSTAAAPSAAAPLALPPITLPPVSPPSATAPSTTVPVVTAPPRPPAPVVAAANPVASTVSVEPPPAKPAPSAAATGAPDNPATRVFGSPESSSRVTIRAHGDSWVDVRGADNEVMFPGHVLHDGDVYHVPNRPDAVLWTGNLGALEIIVDGKPLPRLGSAGEARRNISLDPKSLLAAAPR